MWFFPLSLRERAGERGEKFRKESLFKSPHPVLLPEGDGTYIFIPCSSVDSVANKVSSP
jgi:hypothetical protein